MAVFIVGIIIFVLYPSKKQKIAILWIAVGIIQIILWGLYAYPIKFDYFPSQTVFGIFLLTSGIFLYSFSLIRTSNTKNLLTIISLLIIGCLELLAVINFYFAFPNLSEWNTLIDAWAYVAFLLASVSTFSCTIFVLLKSRMQLTFQN